MFDDENTDAIFNVFSGQQVDLDDDLAEAMEEEAEEVNEEEREAESKNKPQAITATDALPPTATSTSKRIREEDTTTKDTAKRHRVEDHAHTAQPIVADTFEQETSREVANIAGLQSAPAMEGEQITLSHQVRKLNLSYCRAGSF